MAPIRGCFSRSRGFEKMDQKFPGKIKKILKTAMKNHKEVRLLEVGCGEGRVLMELKKEFPSVEMHGINKKPWSAMKGQQSLKKTAELYKIFKKSELKEVVLPQIHFYDAKELKFPDNYFDAIISQVSIHYIKKKAKFLEEVWRVLKIGGKAFLHIDTIPAQIPDFMDFETPRFIIRDGKKIVPLKKIIFGLRKKGFDIMYSNKKGTITIIINKNLGRELKLNLEYDELSSFDIHDLYDEGKDSDIFWGYRSVYRKKDKY